LFSVGRDGCVTPAGMRLNDHEQGAGAVAVILIIVTGNLTGLRWQWVSTGAESLARALIHADWWGLRVIGSSLDLQDIRHPPHKIGTDLGNTPWLLQPRFELTFFKTRPIGS
jgi:hypothetical protein